MTPAYNIRVGKAADRLLFRELLSHLAGTLNFGSYRYVGLGGPFLEDFRLIHEAFPMMKLSSIESKEQVWRRQKFHKPVSNVTLHCCTVEQYFQNHHDDSELVVVWLDYTNLSYNRLREIWELVSRLKSGSIIRVTLRAEGPQEDGHDERLKWATDLFGEYLPQYQPDQLENSEFPGVLLKGIRKVVDSATADLGELAFQLLHAVTYSDGTQMMTVTGMIGDAATRRAVRRALGAWHFKNYNWSAPFHITLPALSLKERLALEPYLPSKRGTGRALHQRLGYSIEGSEPRSVEALDTYRRLAESYPRFVRLPF